MAPLSRLASAKTDQTSMQFLRILEDGLLALPTADARRRPPLEFWNSIADECHAKGFFHYYQAMDFKNQKWPQLYKITLQHHQKTQRLTARDKMVIRIRRLQDPSFCTSSGDEAIPLPEPEKNDEPLVDDEFEHEVEAYDADFDDQHHQKTQRLTARDKMVIRIRRLQDPSFCTSSGDEAIPLPEPEKNDEVLVEDEFEQEVEAYDADFDDVNFETSAMDTDDTIQTSKSSMNNSTGFSPIILPLPSTTSSSNDEILHETLKAITRACNLFSEKTLLEIELLKRQL
uniref:Uncharacterized protein n=1 Tax=Panagrolaimus sp. JU765 TaxID=591449 RepID=A0AC34QZD7_9BILA